MSPPEALTPTALTGSPGRTPVELPRPNLPILDWPEPSGSVPAMVVLFVMLLAAAFGIILLARELLSRGRRASGRGPAGRHAPVGLNQGSGQSELLDATGLIREADAIRGCLVERFGPAWACKTTEELPGLPGWSELPDADALCEFLTFVDRLKFRPSARSSGDRSATAPTPPDPEGAGRWRAWAAGYLGRLAAWPRDSWRPEDSNSSVVRE